MSATKRSLVEISDDLRAIDELMDEVGGELADASLEHWFDSITAEIGAQRDAKVDNYCALIDNLDAQAKRHREDAKRLAEWAQVDENKVRRLKERLLWFFEAQGLQRLVTAHYKPRIQSNGGVQPLAVNLRPEDLPEEFQRVTVEADNDRIRTFLESGEELEWAELLPRQTHLRIK